MKNTSKDVLKTLQSGLNASLEVDKKGKVQVFKRDWKFLLYGVLPTMLFILPIMILADYINSMFSTNLGYIFISIIFIPIALASVWRFKVMNQTHKRHLAQADETLKKYNYNPQVISFFAYIIVFALLIGLTAMFLN